MSSSALLDAMRVGAELVSPTALPASSTAALKLHWLSRLPVADLGSALFTTGLVVITFEYLDGQDSEERATIRLRRILDERAPAHA